MIWVFNIFVINSIMFQQLQKKTTGIRIKFYFDKKNNTCIEQV